MLVRLIAVGLSLAAAYRLGRDPSWETFFTAAGFVLVYLGTETFGHYRSEKKAAADRELFAQLRRDLPYEGSIRFLSDHDLRQVFKRSRLDDLYRFVATWTDQGHKFHSWRIERAKEALRVAADEFLDDLSVNTWPQREALEFQEIPKEWRREQPDRYEEVSGRLNRRATELVQRYEKLIRLGRKVLHV